MNTEGMVVSNELDEEVIPSSQNTPDDNELDDVIPCEPIEFGEQDMASAPIYAATDSLYNEDYSFTPNVSISEMVDIAPHAASTGNELDEEVIPSSQNTLDDDELDDVTVGAELV